VLAGQRFAFGGWAIEMPVARTSGLRLLAVSVLLVVESLSVLRAPRPVGVQARIAVGIDCPSTPRARGSRDSSVALSGFFRR
jgi:hypothetical protein